MAFEILTRFGLPMPRFIFPADNLTACRQHNCPSTTSSSSSSSFSSSTNSMPLVFLLVFLFESISYASHKESMPSPPSTLCRSSNNLQAKVLLHSFSFLIDPKLPESHVFKGIFVFLIQQTRPEQDFVYPEIVRALRPIAPEIFLGQRILRNGNGDLFLDNAGDEKKESSEKKRREKGDEFQKNESNTWKWEVKRKKDGENGEKMKKNEENLVDFVTSKGSDSGGSSPSASSLSSVSSCKMPAVAVVVRSLSLEEHLARLRDKKEAALLTPEGFWCQSGMAVASAPCKVGIGGITS
ncbi:mevalonate kinase [Striga asiatica]|uniref:Mevalonate kinase n=1 Tax=Striga asiatica TaxID=4170 RepID=A0A5A7PEN2_STRAF|nr:mevalonate kinase [Striga asiatica]